MREVDASPDAGGRIPVRCLLFAPPHIKLFDCGVPKPAWSGAVGVIGVCVSGALFFLSLHHPPQIQLWQLLGIPNKRWGLLLCQSPELRLGLWSVVMWLVTVVGV